MNQIELSATTTKEHAIKAVRHFVQRYKLRVAEETWDRPWGGYIVITQDSVENFVKHFFAEHFRVLAAQQNVLKGKLMLIAPQNRLSWHYHNRRSEYERVLAGPVGIIISPTDLESSLGEYQSGDLIPIAVAERHRFVGLNNWAILAEIWKHTDPTRPSNEQDIVRLSDDYGRA